MDRKRKRVLRWGRRSTIVFWEYRRHFKCWLRRAVSAAILNTISIRNAIFVSSLRGTKVYAVRCENSFERRSPCPQTSRESISTDQSFRSNSVLECRWVPLKAWGSFPNLWAESRPAIPQIRNRSLLVFDSLCLRDWQNSSSNKSASDVHFGCEGRSLLLLRLRGQQRQRYL